MHLSEQEQSQINELVAEVEAKSGAQVLVALVGKADAYPEIPWKAFALGASLAALVVMLVEVLHPAWSGVHSSTLDGLVILGAGASAGLLTIFAPPVARLFLDRLRAGIEVRQYAQAMFSERVLLKTHDRIGVLVLVSLFEREVVILPDAGLEGHLADAQIESVIVRMTPLLAERQIVGALRAGLHALAALLYGKLSGAGAPHDELADAVVEERGA